MILVIDSYDSFVWNIVQSLSGLGAEVEVWRNDATSVEELLARGPAGLVLGPGPGRARHAGVLPELLRLAPAELPVFGICLGHQALVEACGGKVRQDPEPVHGRATEVFHAAPAGLQLDLLRDVKSPFRAGRYHSLSADAELPEELVLTAWTKSGTPMGVAHREWPRAGLQFHPDSFLTPDGMTIFRAFLERCGESCMQAPASGTCASPLAIQSSGAR